MFDSAQIIFQIFGLYTLDWNSLSAQTIGDVGDAHYAATQKRGCLIVDDSYSLRFGV